MARRLLLLAATAGLLMSLIVGATASAAPPPSFTVSPATLPFSNVTVGAYAYQNLTVTTGARKVAFDNPATIVTTAPSGTFFDTQAGSCWQTFGSRGLAVPARTACTIQVGFHPTDALSYTGVMTITACRKWQLTASQVDCITFGDSQTVGLSGTGVLPDLIVHFIGF